MNIVGNSTKLMQQNIFIQSRARYTRELIESMYIQMTQWKLYQLTSPYRHQQ